MSSYRPHRVPILFNIFMTIVGALVASIPADLYLICLFLLSPQGFWQNMILLGFGVWILGTFQIILIILFLVWCAIVWSH